MALSQEIDVRKTKFWIAPELGNLELFRATAICYSYARHSHPGYSIGLIEAGVGGNYYRGSTYLAPPKSIILMKAPLNDPIMAEFAAALEQVNAIADQSPGFIWRLKTESGNATQIRAYPDPKMLVNLSVWQSVDQLKTYIYKSLHSEFLVRRRQWFEKYQGEHFAMWWIPVGHLPTVEAGKVKLEQLSLHGDSPEAFTFAKPFPSEFALPTKFES